MTEWEVVVVDDGSSDETVEIARMYASADTRIRVLTQEPRGAGPARNVGIRICRAEWLLFLDADDLLESQHLESMLEAATDRPGHALVMCGWARFAPGGERIATHPPPIDLELFPAFARTCPVAINSVLVRKACIEDVGGFDESFQTCWDWDLWQRIARTGATSTSIPDILALYRARPDSLSLDARQLLTDGFLVITRGHRRDERMAAPAPSWIDGMPAHELPKALLEFAAWIAGLLIGKGSDGREVLPLARHCAHPDIDPQRIAWGLLEATVLPACRPIAAWPDLWSVTEPKIDSFLSALEEHSGTPRLGRRTKTTLERLVFDHCDMVTDLDLGSTRASLIEVTQPIPHMQLERGVERVRLDVRYDGHRLGTVELPVCDGAVSAYVISDAIAHRFGWMILGAFFEQTVYRTLRFERAGESMEVLRGDVKLAEIDDGEDPTPRLHDVVGWPIFLQELWGRPDRPADWFYDSGPQVKDVDQRGAVAADDKAYDWLVVEMGDVPEAARIGADKLIAVVNVGGVAIGSASMEAEGGRVPGSRLRAELTRAAGFELCVAAVREALLGQAVDERSLGDRLAEAVKRRAGADGRAASGNKLPLAEARAEGRSPTLVLGRRGGRISETSAARRAALPGAAAATVRDAADALKEPQFMWGEGTQARRVIYAPECVSQESLTITRDEDHSLLDVEVMGGYGRTHFETLFAHGRDPWGYTTEFEHEKYERTLAMLPNSSIQDALEIGCAEGHFTQLLAPRVHRLVVADISAIAIERAAERCRDFNHVEYVRLDVAADAIPGRFDLIVCSELLYFMGDRARLRSVADKLAAALRARGVLVMAHAHLVVDEPERPGYDWPFPFGAKVIGDVFQKVPTLRLIEELRTPLYRIQLFGRRRTRVPVPGRRPKIVELHEQPKSPRPEVARTALWHGGRPNHARAWTVATHQLPILMYHRVAPHGAEHSRRYRVTPEAFEQQMRYLEESGYRTVTLAAWRAAVAARRPLPGRAVTITFDDAFEDFLRHAWPLLRRFELQPVVFVPTGFVGGNNDWDAVYGEPTRLLSWDQIISLEEQGVSFGSHSATHPFLTGMSWTEVVHEAVSSRVALRSYLKGSIEAFAYPHGDTDASIQHLVGACGYDFGVTTAGRRATWDDPLMSLPRIEVRGDDSFEQFVRKIGD